MTKVLLTIRIEADTKQQLQEFARDLNLTVSALVSSLIKQSVRDRRIFLTSRARGSYPTMPLKADINSDYE